jgi:hypothetical protein
MSIESVELDSEILGLLAGEAAQRDQAVVVTTVDQSGHPRTALLGIPEILLPVPGRIMIAL